MFRCRGGDVAERCRREGRIAAIVLTERKESNADVGCRRREVDIGKEDQELGKEGGRG